VHHLVAERVHAQLSVRVAVVLEERAVVLLARVDVRGGHRAPELRKVEVRRARFARRERRSERRTQRTRAEPHAPRHPRVSLAQLRAQRLHGALVRGRVAVHQRPRAPRDADAAEQVERRLARALLRDDARGRAL
jgi:hypothetical protein